MVYKHMIDVDWKNAGSLFINGDCMEYMKTMPDKCVELAICDPPYGIGCMSMNYTTSGAIRTHG